MIDTIMMNFPPMGRVAYTHLSSRRNDGYKFINGQAWHYLVSQYAPILRFLPFSARTFFFFFLRFRSSNLFDPAGYLVMD